MASTTMPLSLEKMPIAAATAVAASHATFRRTPAAVPRT